jgi:segregation and condensation protein B
MTHIEAPVTPGNDLVAAVEAVLFAAAEPVHPKEIAAAFAGASESEVAAAIEALRERYRDGSGGLTVELVAGAFRLATKPEVGSIVRQFFRQRNRTRLSPAALETLAIIAYRQPITVPEIQAVRGVDPSGALKSLLEKSLVRILGRKKVVGNPLLYGTTKQFLVHFGLNRLEDLPSIEEFDVFLGALAGGQEPLFSRGAGSPQTDDELVETESAAEVELVDPPDIE